MRKIIILILFICFFLKRETVILSGITALNTWSTTLFPLLFPAFIVNDLILSSGIANDIIFIFGPLLTKFFNISPYGAYVLLISFISGTPTNAKNLKALYAQHLIDKNDIVKILSCSIFFNPFLIITLCGWHILIILWLSNLLTGFIMRHALEPSKVPYQKIKIPFNLSTSIESNIDLLLMILGNMTVFMVLSSLIHTPYPLINTLITGFLEVTSGLKATLKLPILIKDLFNIIFLSLGSISIFMQIKSILNDIDISYRYFYISRLLCTFIGVTILVLYRILTY